MERPRKRPSVYLPYLKLGPRRTLILPAYSLLTTPFRPVTFRCLLTFSAFGLSGYSVDRGLLYRPGVRRGGPQEVASVLREGSDRPYTPAPGLPVPIRCPEVQ